jgi:hypothetical protein
MARRSVYSRVRFTVLFLSLLLAATGVWGQIYVDSNATGVSDGSSWADAYTDLQSALAVASGGSEVWVAASTYYPTTSTDRTATFQLVAGVAIYGGFAGTEIMLSERDLSTNTVVLSGDIGLPNDSSDNSYHVVTGSGTELSAILDGFTIRGGNADGSSSQSFGGGILNEDGRPTLRNLFLLENSATYGAAIMNITDADVEIANTVCMNNSAVYGGAIYNAYSSDALLTNLTIVGNAASFGGGGLTNSSSNPTITNSVVWGNTAGVGPQIYNLIDETPMIDHSLIEGSGGSGGSWDASLGIDGGNNIDVDPMLFDVTQNDLRGTVFSPVLDVGDNGAPGLAATDIVGNPRMLDGGVDMGAYEFVCIPGPVVYVDRDAAGAGDGSSWTDAYTSLREALLFVCASVNEVWVAEGTYVPTTGMNREARFTVRSGLGLYGGFDGAETARSERDHIANPTILSGEIGGPQATDNTSTVVSAVDSDSSTVVDGFTITRSYDGSGLLIRHGLVKNLVATDNHSPGGSGGGIRVIGDAQIMDVTLTDNSAGNGGGMHCCCYRQPHITRVLFMNNTASRGGGLSLHTRDNAIVSDLDFVGNTANTGGGLELSSTDNAVVDDARFVGNSAAGGGGVYFFRSYGTSISNSTFTSNSSTGHGGAVDILASRPRMVNVVFEDNVAAGNGGGMACRKEATHPFEASTTTVIGAVFDSNSGNRGGGMYNSGSDATIINSTFFGNRADDSGGGISHSHFSDHELTVTNTVLWGDTAATGSEIHSSGSAATTVSHSLIQGSGGSGAAWDTTLGFDAGSNLDSDPLFAAPTTGDLHLLFGSPAINAGYGDNPDLPSTDVDRNPRIVGWTVDLGAYEYQGTASGVEDPPDPTFANRSIKTVYPNPFNPRVTIVSELDRVRQVVVSVFDVDGRLVRVLLDGPKPAGENRVHWDASDGADRVVASGVYLVRVKAGSWSASRKVVLLK